MMLHTKKVGVLIACALTLAYCAPKFLDLRALENGTRSFFFLTGSTVVSTNLTGTPLKFPFIVEGCGFNTGFLAHILVNAQVALRPALDQVELGTRNPHTLKAMSKDDNMATYVRGVLRSNSSAQQVEDLAPDPRGTYQFHVGMDPYYECTQPDAGQAFHYGGSATSFCSRLFGKGTCNHQANSVLRSLTISSRKAENR